MRSMARCVPRLLKLGPSFDAARSWRSRSLLHEHGDKSDLMESRAAFAEKRKPNFKGWNDPEDRYRLPTLDSVK